MRSFTLRFPATASFIGTRGNRCACGVAAVRLGSVNNVFYIIGVIVVIVIVLKFLGVY